jgi:hypothetical protein
MEPRTFRLVTWSMAVLAVLLAGSAVLPAAGTLVDETANADLISVPYPVVGALFLWRFTGNPIGAFCAVGRLLGMRVCAGRVRARLWPNPGDSVLSMITSSSSSETER